MRVINPLSKEIVKFIGVNMIHGVYSIEYQENKFAQPSTMLVPINLDATTTESFLKIFFEYLKTVDAEYVDYVEDTEYMDWPTEEELPEHNLPYRVFLTHKQIADITADQPALITYAATMCKREQVTGWYIYANNFLPGHVAYLASMGATFDINPYLENVEPIDFSIPKP